MRTFLIALALGAGSVFLLCVPAGFALTIMADSNGWSSFAIGVGPLHIYEYTRVGATTRMLFGVGIPVAALIVGILNASAAHLIRKRVWNH